MRPVLAGLIVVAGLCTVTEAQWLQYRSAGVPRNRDGTVNLLAPAPRTADGRPLPADPTPSWQGYSVGRWDGDWLIVTSIGFTDRSWLDALGHVHSEAMRVTERMRRRDFGHTDVEITIDDANAYLRAFTIAFTKVLMPDDDVLELYCTENERDAEHIVGALRP